jgi:hypothetical protein
LFPQEDDPPPSQVIFLGIFGLLLQTQEILLLLPKVRFGEN